MGTVILYHIGRCPARPKPPRFIPWTRYGNTITEPCAFFTTSWKRVAFNHAIAGNVYAYEVPNWVIAKCGGLRELDHAPEIIITEEYFKHLKFLGKKMDARTLRKTLDSVGDEASRRWFKGQTPGTPLFVKKSKGVTGTMKSNRTTKRRTQRKQNRKQNRKFKD